NDQLDQPGRFKDYPSQSELRWALYNLNEISKNPLNPNDIAKLDGLNPPSPNNNFSDDLDFKQTDADTMFVLIESQMERTGMSDQDMIHLDELSNLIENKGFIKGSDYEAKNSLRLDGVAAVHSNTLSGAKINSLASHRSHTSNGVAANLGAGADVLKQAAASNAHDIAVSKIASAIIDGVLGDNSPNATASQIQHILSAPELSEAAKQLTPQDAIKNAQLHVNGGDLGVNNNTQGANDNTVDANPADTSAKGSEAEVNSDTKNSDTTENSDDKANTKEGDAEKKGKKNLDPNAEEDDFTRKQPSTALPTKPQGGDYMTGAAGVLAALGALTTHIIKGSMRGAIEPPHPSTYDKDYYKNGAGSPNPSSDPNASNNRSSGSTINPNTRNHLVTMQNSILSFESSSRLLEDNKISNTLSMQDKRILEKDLKKQLSVFGNSSQLAAEGLKLSAPDMSSSLRLKVSDHLTKSSKDMKSLFDKSQDKGLFSANDRQKEMMENTMAAIGGAVSSLRNSIMVSVKSFFSPSRG
ncbi:MAG: hypothetical protein J6N72_07005, partial [Psychrobacter sp.]|nr:hypothetical protein [Psychrobacter sp.]